MDQAKQEEKKQSDETKGAMPLSFDEWIAAQEEPIKNLVATRFSVLENTVKATRDERDAFSKQLKALSKQLEEGSATKQAVDEMAIKLEKTERRAAFMEESMKPEVQCKNPRAAFMLAEADNLFTKRGEPDWVAIQTAAPELFGQAPKPNANAGNGTQKAPSPAQNMNDFIRKASGRTR